MILPVFKYKEADSLPEALSFLCQHKAKAKIIAGGTDLIVQMKKKEISPQYLLGLQNITELKEIGYLSNHSLKIGTLATLSDILKFPDLETEFPILVEALRHMGSVQTRNLATIGGNICNAAPSADIPPPLIVLGAELKLRSIYGEREVKIEDFFTGPSRTILNEDEILTEIIIPLSPPRSFGRYIKHTVRKAMDLALLGVALMIAWKPEGICEKIRIALATAAPKPFKVPRVEEEMEGKEINRRFVDVVSQIVFDEASPRSSWRASAEYRREMVKVFTRRILLEAMEVISMQESKCPSN